MSIVVERSSGPNLLVRFVWWLFIGWWASGIVVGLAWLSLISIVGIPLGIWLINHLPSVLTLRPRTRVWSMGLGRQRANDHHRGQPGADPVAGPRPLVRPRRMVGVGPLDGRRVGHPADRDRPPAGPPDVQPDAVRGVALPLLMAASATCEPAPSVRIVNPHTTGA